MTDTISIPENTFAAACYEQNSIDELEQALRDGPDSSDMQEWSLNAEEWRDQVQMALDALRAEAA